MIDMHTYITPSMTRMNDVHTYITTSMTRMNDIHTYIYIYIYNTLNDTHE